VELSNGNAYKHKTVNYTLEGDKGFGKITEVEKVYYMEV
jgi:hypothetical protein